MSQKTFHTQDNIGKVKYTVNFHDGVKTYADASPFFDIKTFTNKKVRDQFCKDLKKREYTENGVR